MWGDNFSGSQDISSAAESDASSYTQIIIQFSVRNAREYIPDIVYMQYAIIMQKYIRLSIMVHQSIHVYQSN